MTSKAGRLSKALLLSAWRWWNSSWMAHWGRFVVFNEFALIVYIYLKTHPTTRKGDARIELAIATGAFLIVITTCFGVFFITKSWTLRAAGIVGFAGGVGMLMVILANNYYKWWTRNTNREIIDFDRAYFVAGLPILFAGIILWVVRVYRDNPSIE